MTRSASVFVVDDDPSLLRALSRLLGSAGYRVETFVSPEAFLNRPASEEPSCLILDVSMPAMSGLEVQEQVRRQAAMLPIVFLSGRAKVPDSVKAMQQGAVDFLLKPVAAEQLLKVVAEAVRRHEFLREERDRKDALLRRWEMLTPREREVGALVTRGLLNKQIAGDLGITEKTVKIHRARVMAKLGVDSVPALVRYLEAIGTPSPGLASEARNQSGERNR